VCAQELLCTHNGIWKLWVHPSHTILENARNGAGIILFKQTVMDIESVSGALSFPNLHCQYIYHEAVYLMLHFIQLD